MKEGGSLERFVPRVAAEWDLDVPGTRWRRIDGTLCFVDISGFTNLSEKLARRGRVGAEELTEVLDRVFGNMLRLAYARGGSLLKFGGDALLLMFEGDDHPAQGASAAVEMRAALRKATEIPTSVGVIRLKMSVGLHTGLIDLFLVGDSHRELVITGATATTTTEMEAAADAGEILVSRDLAARLPRTAVGNPKGPGVLLRWRRAPVEPVGPLFRRPVGPDVLARCVPTVLRSHLDHGVAEPEHRVATVGFIKFKGVDAAMAEGGHDLVASGLDELVTAVQAAVDPEGVTFLATDIDADGGKVILTTGVPGSQEDDEGRMLRAVRRIADAGTSFPLKIGVNRGHVFAGEIGTEFRSTYTVMGDTVNLAARLMAAAPPGAVYAAPGVLDRSRTLFATEALEPFHVKGKAEPVQAYAVGAETGSRTTPTHRELPFTGRDDELATLRKAIDALGSGSGGAITVTGDTGFGKSRLVVESLTGSPIPTLTVRAEPYGATNPYWAFRDPLRSLLGIERGDQAEMAAALAEKVTSLDRRLVPYLPLIGNAAHIDLPDTPETAAIEPRFRPDRTAATLVGLLEAALPGPLVIVVEDGHWIDEASASLVTMLASVAAPLRPWLVILTARPGGDHLSDPIGTEIPLGPLSDEASRTLAITATEAAPLRPHELETIVSRAAGNPLFLEEILRLVRSTGSVDALPESLDAVVGAEIDTLRPLTRRLLRYSSVLGRSFRRVVLDELLAPENVVLDAATRRELARFVEPEGTHRWRFRHSVMHDVAYQGLSYRKRRELHARAGEVIERLAGADTDSVAEFLALHYAEAGEHEKAWRYGVVAGDKARRAFAPVEAAGHYRRALETARRLASVSDRDRATVWTALGDVQELTGEYERARGSFGAALQLSAESGHVTRADLLLRRAKTKMREGRYASALADVSRGRRLIDGRRDEAELAAAARLDSFRAAVYVSQERYREALRSAQEAERSAAASGEREALARAYVVLDWASYMLGRATDAVYGELALDLYRELNQPDKASDVMLNLGAWAYYEGRWDEAVDWYRRAREEATRAANETAAALAGANIAEVRIGQGRLEEAAEVLAHSVRVLRAAGDAYGALFADTQVGRLLMARGDAGGARELLSRLRTEAEALGQASTALEVAALEALALTELGEAQEALRLLEESEARAGEEAALLHAVVGRARAQAHLRLGALDQAAVQIGLGVEAARKYDLAYDEVLLLDLREGVDAMLGHSPDLSDAERARDLRARLGVVSG